MDLTALAERAVRRHAAGVAASDDGQPAVAVRHLRAGLQLVDRAGSTVGAVAPQLSEVRGRLLVSLAWAESERGRVDLGFQLLDQAEPGIPEGQRPLLLAQRALLLKRCGRNDAALPWLDQAIALFESWPDKLYLVKALNNRSLIHLDAGHVRLARADLRRCGQIAARHGLDLHVTLSRVNLGCLDVLAGNLPAALGAFAGARPEYELRSPGRLSGLAVERARALLAAGLFGAADRELAQALEHAARQRLSHLYADALLVRAEAALLAGRPGAAAHWAGQARARFLGRDNARRAALAALLELRATSTIDIESPGGAGTPGAAGGAGTARAAEAMAARLSRLGLPEDARVAGLVAARAWLREGRVSRAQRAAARYGAPGRVDRLDTRLLWRLTRAELATSAGRPAEASRQLLAGMTALHRHRSQFGCLDLQTGAAVHGQDLARAGLAAAVASGRSDTVYRWAERARAQALLLPPVRPPRDPEAAAALEELRQGRHALHDAELAGRPTGTLRGRIAALQRTVRERTWSRPGQRSAAGAATVPLATIRAELGAAALVMYLRDGGALRALTVVDGAAELTTLGGHAGAEEAVLRLRADLDARAGRALPERLAAAVTGATARDARELAAAVLDPLLDRVGDRDLIVVPTGVLVTVPWSMLPGCAGRPVTVTPSATAWRAARCRSDPGLPGAGTLLVAGPGNARGEAEVSAIAELRPQSTVLSGPSATPAATLEALRTATVAHLAAHGHHQAENALFSSLDLAGGPLLGYDLPGAGRTPSMVVLSSCDLGLSDVRPGDETFGMATALLAAGTATVVASVARVADDAAMAVMVRYHRGIVAGRSPAAALAAALEPDPAAAFICLGAG